MDPKQRLHLNFGGGYSSDRNYDPTNSRVYPTTPSTFPQPVFGNQGGQTPNAYSQQLPSPYTQQSGGYFPQVNEARSPNPMYQGQYQQFQPQQQNLVASQSQYQQRQPGYNSNDPTSGLAHQFQNQNLGNQAPRQPSPYGRQPSPGSRMYNNTQPNSAQSRTQQAYASNQRVAPSLIIPSPNDFGGRTVSPSREDIAPPDRNPDKYAPNVIKRGNGLHTTVEAFFKENITRARDRNQRYVQTRMLVSHELFDGAIPLT